MKIGKAVQKIRKAKKMTLDQVAKKMNRGYQFVSAVEKGKVEPTKEDLRLFAKAFDVTPETILCLGMEKKDVRPGVEEVYKSVMPTINKLIMSLLTTEPKKKKPVKVKAKK